MRKGQGQGQIVLALYYTKSYFPLEISQRAFDHLWRMCESYELWCKETNQLDLITLKLID